MFVQDRAHQVLGEEIRAVVRAWDLDQRDDLLGGLLLEPEHVHIYVPDFRDALSLQNPLCSRRVEVKPNLPRFPHVIVEGDEA